VMDGLVWGIVGMCVARCCWWLLGGVGGGGSANYTGIEYLLLACTAKCFLLSRSTSPFSDTGSAI